MKKLFFVFIIIIIILCGGFFWWHENIQPVNSSDKTLKPFVINHGENIREIAYALKKDSLIRDPVTFFLLVKQQGYEGKIQAGNFQLSSSMTMPQIAENLTHGISDIWVTIPEGKRAEEIVDIFRTKFPSVDASWIDIFRAHEGYLFPDTYLVPHDPIATNIVSIMQTNFYKQQMHIQKSDKNAFSNTDLLILASIIEREAKFPEDRYLVASVLENRLKINMALQVDASIQYLLGYQVDEKTWWKKNLTESDLKINSPFNTYINTGLPPKPISNPGLSALQAAYNPASTDYLYYISDKSGHLHFARTLEEHNANIRKYGL